MTKELSFFIQNVGIQEFFEALLPSIVLLLRRLLLYLLLSGSPFDKFHGILLSPGFSIINTFLFDTIRILSYSIWSFILFVLSSADLVYYFLNLLLS